MKLSDVVKAGVANTLASGDKWPTHDGQHLDRAKFVTASEVGQCLRRIWFSKFAAANEIPPAKPTGWGFFQRGHNVEAWIVQQLRNRQDDSVSFMFIGDQQVSFHHEGRSGTPDGIMIDGMDVVLFDIKSIDPRTNRRYLPKPAHVQQVIQNMDLVAECIDVKPTRGKLLYVNCSDYEDMLEIDVEYDEEISADLVDRAARVHAAEAADQLPPEGIYDGGCKFCTFTGHCNAAQEEARKLKKRHKLQEETAKDVFGKR